MQPMGFPYEGDARGSNELSFSSVSFDSRLFVGVDVSGRHITAPRRASLTTDLMYRSARAGPGSVMFPALLFT
jgi:hypothetical protein